MKPPFNITSEILSLISSISEKLGEIKAYHLEDPRPELRKANKIKTIQASLGIEGNTLSIDQVTALIEKKRVLGPQKDIAEVQNAIVVYDKMFGFKPTSISSFLQGHFILMKGLIANPGQFRSSGAGIIKGSKLAHVAPPAGKVRALMNELFSWLKKDNSPALIKSCVFHYELEFIHPFEDGNGRMGRFWQSVILKEYNPVFAYLPVESIIKKRQNEYYKALSISDKSGNSTVFIEFMLSAIENALSELVKERRGPMSAVDRILNFKNKYSEGLFSRKDYLIHFKDISSATASRDLKWAVDNKLLKRVGDKNKATYQFI